MLYLKKKVKIQYTSKTLYSSTGSVAQEIKTCILDMKCWVRIPLFLILNGCYRKCHTLKSKHCHYTTSLPQWEIIAFWYMKVMVQIPWLLKCFSSFIKCRKDLLCYIMLSSNSCYSFATKECSYTTDSVAQVLKHCILNVKS